MKYLWVLEKDSSKPFFITFRLERKILDLFGNEEIKKEYDFIEKEVRNYESLKLTILEAHIAELSGTFDEYGTDLGLAERIIDRLKSNRRLKERLEKEKESLEIQEAAGNRLLEETKLQLDVAEAGEAFIKMDEFLRKYPTHSRVQEVVRLKEETEQSIDLAFRATKSKVDSFMQLESYENAWKEVYNFLDKIQNYEPAKKLQEELSLKTYSRAVQYYNQGRVFEYETDDLVAAEQYYRRSLEVADPRSDLAEKANRRYLAVRQKTVQ